MRACLVVVMVSLLVACGDSSSPIMVEDSGAGGVHGDGGAPGYGGSVGQGGSVGSGGAGGFGLGGQMGTGGSAVVNPPDGSIHWDIPPVGTVDVAVPEVGRVDVPRPVDVVPIDGPCGGGPCIDLGRVEVRTVDVQGVDVGKLDVGAVDQAPARDGPVIRGFDAELAGNLLPSAYNCCRRVYAQVDGGTLAFCDDLARGDAWRAYQYLLFLQQQGLLCPDLPY